jgi:RHS repeat-associated protein
LGQQVTELDSGNNWIHSNVFDNNAVIATYDSYGLHFHFSDPLGSRRAQVNSAANSTVTTDELCSSLPFGDGQTCTGGGFDSTEHHFTGKERDTESGNDNFGARFYASGMGRFISPDPSQLYYADPKNPQSFNLYSYTQNNPLKNTDPTGMYCYYGAMDGPEADNDEKDRNQFDYHSNEAECTRKDENGNQGQWIDDWGTHSELGLGGVDDDDREENYMMAPSLPQGVVGAPPTEATSIPPIDPDQVRIDTLVQGVATDVAWLPTVCKFTNTLQVSTPLGSLALNDTEKGDSLSYSLPSATLAKYARASVGMNSQLAPTGSVKIGTPFVGGAVNLTSGQLGGYVGREFGIGKKAKIGVTLTMTVGKISTYNGCHR